MGNGASSKTEVNILHGAQLGDDTPNGNSSYQAKMIKCAEENAALQGEMEVLKTDNKFLLQLLEKNGIDVDKERKKASKIKVPDLAWGLKNLVISVEGDTVIFDDDDLADDDEEGIILYSKPIDEVKYFEIKLLDTMGLAIALAPKSYPINERPGLRAPSIAWHESGEIYRGNAKLATNIEGITSFGKLDVLGAGKLNGKYFFTYNGVFQGFFEWQNPAIKDKSSGSSLPKLFPCIGMWEKGSVSVNMGQTPYLFDPQSISAIDLVWAKKDVIITYEGDSISFDDDGLADEDEEGGIMYSKTISEVHYFEITIEKEMGSLAVGLTNKNYSPKLRPGWESSQIAWQSDSAKIFRQSNSDNIVELEKLGKINISTHKNQKCTIGCGYSADIRKDSIYYTKDGEFCGWVACSEIPEFSKDPVKLYPTIAMWGSCFSLSVNMGQKDFVFDSTSLQSHK